MTSKIVIFQTEIKNFSLNFMKVLIHRRVKAKRKQRQFIGHRASLQSMDHVALGVIPKSRPSSGYWNPALDDTLELVLFFFKVMLNFMLHSNHKYL